MFGCILFTPAHLAKLFVKLPQVGTARDPSLHSCPALEVRCSHHDGAKAVPSRRQGQEAGQLQGDAPQLSTQSVASRHLRGDMHR